MARVDDFDLGQFITSSLCLQANTYSPTQVLPPKQFKNPYDRYFHQNPLDVLGEKSFEKSAETPKDVVGTEVQEFYRDAHVLITGGTGCLGKLLTEKLLRSVPQLGHVYLLIRNKRGKDTKERFEQLLQDKVFRRMREEIPWYRSKITAVSGDLYEPGLALSAADRQLLTDQISVVLHGAADVKFTEPLRVAIAVNVVGSQRIMDLARSMVHLKAYVHVSTAFSHCVRRVIPETVPRMNLPHRDILSYVETRGDDLQDSDVIRLMQGWPNTYTFSKGLCEIMVEEDYNDLPISIFRPSVIIPTYKEPVRGWTDNLYGPVGLMVASGLGVFHGYHLNEELSLDIVPADYVINAIIAAAWDTGINRRSGSVKVFNYTTTSPQRQWSWKHAARIAEDSFNCWPFNKCIWATWYYNHTNRWVFEFIHFVFHVVPAWLGDRVLSLVGQRPRLMKICKKVNDLKPSLEHFLFTCFEFQNDNVKSLWCSLSDQDKSLFNFDTSSLDVLENTLLGTLGVKYYFFNEGVDSLPAARRRQTWLNCIHVAVKITCLWMGLRLAAHLARALPL